MILYQNGMQNTEKDAEAGAKKLEGITGKEVGTIHNETAGKGLIGIGEDYLEYLPQGLTVKDILNAQVYENLAKNGEQNLVVMFSAGNEDAYKALQYIGAQGGDLGGKVDFVSVGSPKDENVMKNVVGQAGGNFVGQANDWKDPVTNGAVWVGGAIGLGATAAVVGGVALGSVGVEALASSGSLDTVFNGIIGAGVGAGVGKYSLSTYHSFEGYIDRNVGNIQGVITEWSDQNSPGNNSVLWNNANK